MLSFLDKAAKDKGMQLLIKKLVDLFQTELSYFFHPEEKNHEPVFACTKGAPQEPVAILSVGTILNCQLYQN